MVSPSINLSPYWPICDLPANSFEGNLENVPSSEFREPPSHNITREDRIKILVQFDGIRAGIYKHCRSERGQAVYNYQGLLSFAVKRRRVFPSLDTIARMAMVSKRTVSHAIAWLSLYGFLDKLRRIVRTSGLLGPRERQTSNAYVLCFPKGLGGLAVAAFKISPERNNCPPSESNSEVKKFQGSGPDLGLTAALGRLKFSVGRRSEA